MVLRYYEDLSEAEIAATLDMAPGTVKSHAHAARAGWPYCSRSPRRPRTTPRPQRVIRPGGHRMSLDRRLTDAARHLAERVDPPEIDLAAVRAGAHANRRRTIALTVAAAAGVVALAGIPLFMGGRDSTAPRPATTTTVDALRDLDGTPCTQRGCVSLGLYSIRLGYSADGAVPLTAMLRVESRAWAPEGLDTACGCGMTAAG